MTLYCTCMPQVALIVHDIRSTHNVGSLLRTAECMGVGRTYFTGYTPYPTIPDDARLPHIHTKLTQQIQKTALGTEAAAAWEHHEDINTLLDELHAQGYTIAALEQSPASISLPAYRPTEKTALLIGREVEGIDPNLLSRCDIILEIPQYGEKESLNVVQATAIALYHLRTVRETSDPL